MSKQQAADKEWLSASEACKHLGIGRRTLNRWMTEEGLPFRRPGGRMLRFRRSELDRFVERSKA